MKRTILAAAVILAAGWPGPVGLADEPAKTEVLSDEQQAAQRYIKKKFE